jgi:hypothetical protein
MAATCELAFVLAAGFGDVLPPVVFFGAALGAATRFVAFFLGAAFLTAVPFFATVFLGAAFIAAVPFFAMPFFGAAFFAVPRVTAFFAEAAFLGAALATAFFFGAAFFEGAFLATVFLATALLRAAPFFTGFWMDFFMVLVFLAHREGRATGSEDRKRPSGVEIRSTCVYHHRGIRCPCWVGRMADAIDAACAPAYCIF